MFEIHVLISECLSGCLSILAEDGYKVGGIKQVVRDKEATGFIIIGRTGGDALHIGLANDDNTWSADQGMYKPDGHVTKFEAFGLAGQKPSVEEVRNISNTDRNKGTATGITVVDPDQVKKYRNC